MGAVFPLSAHKAKAISSDSQGHHQNNIHIGIESSEEDDKSAIKLKSHYTSGQTRNLLCEHSPAWIYMPPLPAGLSDPWGGGRGIHLQRSAPWQTGSMLGPTAEQSLDGASEAQHLRNRTHYRAHQR